MTSVFSGTWICPQCGREFCDDCRNRLALITTQYIEDESEHSPFAINQSQKLKLRYFQERQSYYSVLCSEQVIFHLAERFIPITYFEPGELQATIVDMQTKLRESSNIDTALRHAPLNAIISHGHVTNPWPDTSGLQSLSISRYPITALTELNFRSIWVHGTPLLIDGLLPSITQLWTPQGLVESYGQQKCTIEDCTNENTKIVKVADFFGMFGAYDSAQRNGCWKLKVSGGSNVHAISVSGAGF